MDTSEGVLSFFQQKGGIPGGTREEQLSYHYLDEGIVDSMGIVEMVMAFEKGFGIHFSSSDMQSWEFRTVGGLIDLIERLRAVTTRVENG